MTSRVISFALTVFLSVSTICFAHGPDQAPHQVHKMGDLKLESGETIKDFAISYVTHGTLNAKKSNVILMVTVISGNHHRLDFMIGPGKSLDTNKYFIICTDAIANGLTTSPSNSTAQPRMQFPKFVIRDMVTSQHRLLTEHLGINHVVSVVGPSMGGMQALQWGISHPDFMDGLVALVPLAKTPAWTVAVLEATRKAIMLDPGWNQGNYTSPPENGIRLWREILNFLAARSPELYREQFPNQLDVLPWYSSRKRISSKHSMPMIGFIRLGRTSDATSAARRASTVIRLRHCRQSKRRHLFCWALKTCSIPNGNLRRQPRISAMQRWLRSARTRSRGMHRRAVYFRPMSISSIGKQQRFLMLSRRVERNSTNADCRFSVPSRALEWKRH